MSKNSFKIRRILTVLILILVSGKKSLVKQQHQQRYRPQQAQPEIQSTSPEENVPSYMRSTSSSTKKERPISAVPALMSTPRRRYENLVFFFVNCD